MPSTISQGDISLVSCTLRPYSEGAGSAYEGAGSTIRFTVVLYMYMYMCGVINNVHVHACVSQ